MRRGRHSLQVCLTGRDTGISDDCIWDTRGSVHVVCISMCGVVTNI